MELDGWSHCGYDCLATDASVRRPPPNISLKLRRRIAAPPFSLLGVLHGNTQSSYPVQLGPTFGGLPVATVANSTGTLTSHTTWRDTPLGDNAFQAFSFI